MKRSKISNVQLAGAANDADTTELGISRRQHAADVVADGLVSVRFGTNFLGVSRSKFYQLMDEGELVFVKLGRARRIPRRALIEYAAAHLQGGWSAK